MANVSANSSPCHPISEVYPDAVDGLRIRLLFGILYCIVWLPGITGNILVLYVALLKKVSFTVRTVFITSLATSDLIIGLTSLPFTGITIFTRVWPFTVYMCHFISFTQTASTFVSSFTLTAIALDRYFLIVKPYKQILTYYRARLCVLFVWVLGYCLSLPLGIFAKIKSYEQDDPPVCDLFCEEDWPSPVARRTYSISVSIIQFSLPLCLSCFCYTSISTTLGRQIEHRKKQTILPEAERRLINRRRRTNRMMTVMVLLFALAWSPMLFVNLLRDFNVAASFINGENFNLVFAVCHIASMTSIIWNPLIYSWFNEPFRTAIMNFTEPAVMRLRFNKLCCMFRRKPTVYKSADMKSVR